MDRYVGVDVHTSSCTFVVLDSTGKLLRRDVVETNGRALVGYVKQMPGDVHLCLEESGWSQWLVEILSPRAAEVVVYRAEWKPGSKSDAIDAQDLAEKLRTGQVKRPVFKDTKRFTALRDLARTYTMLTQDVVRAKNRLKSFYRDRGVPCRGTSVYSTAGRAKMSRHVPAATRRATALIGQELEYLESVQAEAKAQMVKESHRHKVSRILETAPGMGPIRVAQMLPIVVTPHRFRSKRQFWAYCGFGVVTHSSADWVFEDGRWNRKKIRQTRGLNFNHNRTLKAIMKGAATRVLTQKRRDPLKDDYERLLANGTKPNLAKLTIARKISAIVLAMWKREEKYAPEKYRLIEAR